MQAPSSVFLLVFKKKTSGALLSSSWKSGLEFTWNVPLRVRLSSCTTFDCADCADSLPRQKQITQALFESHEDPAEGAIYRRGVGVAPRLRVLVRHFRHCFGTTFIRRPPPKRAHYVGPGICELGFRSPATYGSHIAHDGHPDICGCNGCSLDPIHPPGAEHPRADPAAKKVLS